jgi:hypothetical protein
MEVPSSGQAVAGVVSDPTDHGRPSPAEAGDLPAGSLHQPINRDAEALVRKSVDLGDLPASEGR